MPIVIAIAVAARWLLKYTITKALLFLGLGYVSYIGIDLVFDEAEAAIYSHLGGLPADAFNLALMCGIDVYVSLVFSAYAAFLIIRGVSAGIQTALRFSSR